MWQEFEMFLLRGNVIDLAVAVVIAGEELLVEIRDLVKAQGGSTLPAPLA